MSNSPRVVIMVLFVHKFQVLLYGGSPPPTLQLAREQVGAAPPYNRTVEHQLQCRKQLNLKQLATETCFTIRDKFYKGIGMDAGFHMQTSYDKTLHRTSSRYHGKQLCVMCYTVNKLTGKTRLS